MAEHGTDVWWSRDEVDCSRAVQGDADQYSKGTDTMDVWFDSGSSWSSVAQTRPELDCKPGEVDMYLEGSDQHRGWFQSSLLTSVAAHGVAPYKAVLTHGFVLDEKGYASRDSNRERGAPLSPHSSPPAPLLQVQDVKVAGNVVDPKLVIEGSSSRRAAVRRRHAAAVGGVGQLRRRRLHRAIDHPQQSDAPAAQLAASSSATSTTTR